MTVMTNTGPPVPVYPCAVVSSLCLVSLPSLLISICAICDVSARRDGPIRSVQNISLLSNLCVLVGCTAYAVILAYMRVTDCNPNHGQAFPVIALWKEGKLLMFWEHVAMLRHV
jgi:hypothetical protein